MSMKKPYYFNIPGVTRNCDVWIYPQNNLRLKDLDVEPFDIITCDGPYGILSPPCEWDDFDLNTKIGRERFRQYHRRLFTVAIPYLKNSGSLIVFNYPEYASIIKNVLDDEYPVCFRRWISWIYDNHFDFDRGANFCRSHETILYYTKEPRGFYFTGDNMTDVISHPIIKIENHAFKLGAKPIEVVRTVLRPAAYPGGRLLSLFAGSGTDLMVATELDMDAVGFEFNEKNINGIIERLSGDDNAR